MHIFVRAWWLMNEAPDYRHVTLLHAVVPAWWLINEAPDYRHVTLVLSAWLRPRHACSESGLASRV